MMKKRSVLHAVIMCALIVTAALCLMPFWFMFTMASTDAGSMLSSLPVLPQGKLMETYQTLCSKFNIWRAFANSLIVAVCSTAMQLFFSTLAAYTFAKHQFRAKELLFGFIFVTMFIPGQLAWIGFVQEMKALHLLDTWWPLILPSLGSGFAIFVMRGYIGEAIPDSLIESARLDGCGEIRSFLQIVVPLVVPMLASLAILLFMGSWNNFAGALVVLFDPKKYTLPLTLATIKNMLYVDYPLMCCGVLVSTIPVVVVFLCASRLFIGALTSGAVKG